MKNTFISSRASKLSSVFEKFENHRKKSLAMSFKYHCAVIDRLREFEYNVALG